MCSMTFLSIGRNRSAFDPGLVGYYLLQFCVGILSNEYVCDLCVYQNSIKDWWAFSLVCNKNGVWNWLSRDGTGCHISAELKAHLL